MVSPPERQWIVAPEKNGFLVFIVFGQRPGGNENTKAKFIILSQRLDLSKIGWFVLIFFYGAIIIFS